MSSAEILIKKIKEKIEQSDFNVQESEVGRVVSAGDGIVKISGLSDCAAMETLVFKTPEKDIYGVALNLEEDEIGAVLFEGKELVSEGTRVRKTGEILAVPVGENILGRVTDALLRPVDGEGEIESKESYPVEKVAPGVMTRQPVNQPVQTGIMSVDGMIPIGRGQRELVIGDRQTGKTALAIDTIINQKGEDMICIYVAIGQ